MHTKLKTSAARQERVVHALKIFYVALKQGFTTFLNPLDGSNAFGK